MPRSMPSSPTIRRGGRTPGIDLVVTAGAPVRAAAKAQTERATEWLMLTSGTSGVPKIVSHTPGGTDRRDCRGRSGARRAAGVGDLL